MTNKVVIQKIEWEIDISNKQLVNTKTKEIRKLVNDDELDHFRSIANYNG
jgi:hypothetical protein